MATHPPKRHVLERQESVIQWQLDTRYPGAIPVEMDDGEGKLSRWNTLWSLRVLRWYAATSLPQDEDG